VLPVRLKDAHMIIDTQNIQDLRQWVCWRTEERGGKPTKVPYSPLTGERASSTDSETWTNYEEAVRARKGSQQGYHGIGLVFTPDDDLCGVDLDDCLDPKTGEIESWAQEVIDDLGSYTEISSSGTGVHVLVRAKLPAGRNRKGRFEAYDRGRYFTFTGRHLSGTPQSIEGRQEQLECVVRRMLGQLESENGNRVARHSPRFSSPRRDEEVIGKACAENGGKFNRLWHGDMSDYDNDHSAADDAFVHKLWSYTQDEEQIKRIHALSGLHRSEKSGRRPDYLERSINRARENVTWFYPWPDVVQLRPHGNGRQSIHTFFVSYVPEPATWPVLADKALYGLPGEVVRAVEPHTEADPVAVLANILCAFGNAVGRGAYVRVGADRHYLNLCVGLVGETSKGRKGMSWGYPRDLMHSVDKGWVDERVQNGLSSGEGLIHAVRDPLVVTNKDGEPVTVDEGAKDKRLFVVEGEFAAVLKVMSRQGNTLSPVVRQAWDGGRLQILTKNSPIKATRTHVSIVGHVTKAELLRHLTETETANGFANRFIWLMVRRSKVLPFGGQWHTVDVVPVVRRLGTALEFGKNVGEIKWGESAKELWRGRYVDLSRGMPGLFGAVVGRAEAQVLRVTTVYAVMDCSKIIERPHLEATLAL
jgi:hypothetical protein